MKRVYPDIKIGDVFGLLTVIAPAPTIADTRRWVCLCGCGKEKIIRGGSLKRGNTKSCGCMVAEWARERFTKHGCYLNRSVNRTAISWKLMNERCHNPKSPDYARYGAVGIFVCDRWRHADGLTNFISDIGERPENTTIDRINGSLGYFKENCRWATDLVQANNRKNNVWHEFDEKRMTAGQWARHLGIPREKIWYKIKKGIKLY